jgi:IS66 C-terminal element
MSGAFIEYASDPRLDADHPENGVLFHADSHETCKLNDIEPQAYITGVLDRLVNL